MTTLNDYVALQADHGRLRIAARQALDLLETVSAAAGDGVDIEMVRRELSAALDDEPEAGSATPAASSKSPVADENAPLTREELIGLFGDLMPIEARTLIRGYPDKTMIPDGKTIPEIRAALHRIAAKRSTAFYNYEVRGGRHFLNFAPPVRVEPPYDQIVPVRGFAYIGREGALAGVELLDGPPPQHA